MRGEKRSARSRGACKCEGDYGPVTSEVFHTLEQEQNAKIVILEREGKEGRRVLLKSRSARNRKAFGKKGIVNHGRKITILAEGIHENRFFSGGGRRRGG